MTSFTKPTCTRRSPDLAGATEHIPGDRVIDGVDQTSLLLNGDTHSRRDYVFIYAGPNLGATVKGNYKRHWISPDPVGEASGIPAAFYFLPADTREKTPMLVNLIHLKSPFNRMRFRHELWKKKYPDLPERPRNSLDGHRERDTRVQGTRETATGLEEAAVRPIRVHRAPGRTPIRPQCRSGSW